jgi:hypothetical protein
MKVDDFTKDTTYKSENKQIGKAEIKERIPHYIGAQVDRLGHLYILFLFPEFPYKQSFKEGEIISLLFDDKTVMDISVNSNDKASRTAPRPFTQGDKARVYTSTLQFILSDENKETLRSKKVTKIRVGATDFMIDKKRQTEIQSQIRCLEKY